MGSSAALFDNRARNPSGESLLPQRADHVADLVGSGASEPVGCAFTVRRIHAHVERTVVLEAETTRAVVELRRRHAEVEQNPATGTSFAMCLDQ